MVLSTRLFISRLTLGPWFDITRLGKHHWGNSKLSVDKRVRRDVDSHRYTVSRVVSPVLTFSRLPKDSLYKKIILSVRTFFSDDRFRYGRYTTVPNYSRWHERENIGSPSFILLLGYATLESRVTNFFTVSQELLLELEDLVGVLVVREQYNVLVYRNNRLRDNNQ